MLMNTHKSQGSQGHVVSKLSFSFLRCSKANSNALYLITSAPVHCKTISSVTQCTESPKNATISQNRSPRPQFGDEIPTDIPRSADVCTHPHRHRGFLRSSCTMTHTCAIQIHPGDVSRSSFRLQRISKVSGVEASTE